MKRLLAISLVVVLASSLVIVAYPPQPAMAQSTYYVDDDAPNDPGPNDPTVSDPLEDGSAAHPFDEIQEGIDEASYGDTVYVAGGTYYENITLNDGVQVLGAGADVTIIDGGGSGSVVTAISVGSETVLDGFTITGGSADWHGGGMRITYSSLTISNNTFSANSALWSGGGIDIYDSSVNITNCIFEDNTAGQSGGALHIVRENTISINIIGNCFKNNTASYSGGAISTEFVHSITMINNALYENFAGHYGGGIAFWWSSPNMMNNTLHGNTVPETGDGGGIYFRYASATIVNSIIYGNSDNLDGGDYTITYSNIEGGAPGVGNISEDPMFVDPGNNDYHLQAGSPCIDAGTNTGAPTEDIEGNPRPIDGDGDTIAITDMGAYEYVPPVAPAIEATVDFNPDTLNLKSKGKWVTCYIELPEDYEVEDIDVSTVQLSYGESGVSAEWGDIQDGVLMVKFYRSEVQDGLEPGDEVEVTVSGELTDGTLFEGTDTIRVIESGNK